MRLGTSGRVDRSASLLSVTGGTHGSIVTMDLDLTSADSHIDYLAAVATALGRMKQH
jgi:hypothetical protein